LCLYDLSFHSRPINYTQQYNTLSRDMTDVFQGLINHDYVSTTLGEPFRMLIYNGDSDIVCSFLEAEFFIDNLATNMSASVTVPRQEWLYSIPGSSPMVGPGAAAGFRKSYSFAPNVQMDLLTVKVGWSGAT
jgi:Serine carboxypeptidase